MKFPLLAICLGAILARGAEAVPLLAGLDTGNSQSNLFSSAGHGQQVFNASEFSSLSGPQLLVGLAFDFRPVGGSLPYVLPAGATFRISTTSQTSATLAYGSNFASNLGADVTTVFSHSPYTVGSSTFTSALAADGTFEFYLPFDTPFLYSGGNLLVDWVIPSGNPGGGVTFQANSPGATSSTKAIFSSNPASPDSAAGSTPTSPVVLFNFVAAPELDASAAALPIALLMTVLGVVGEKRRRSTSTP